MSLHVSSSEAVSCKATWNVLRTTDRKTSTSTTYYENVLLVVRSKTPSSFFTTTTTVKYRLLGCCHRSWLRLYTPSCTVKGGILDSILRPATGLQLAANNNVEQEGKGLRTATNC